jgi:hypothetical protein
MIGRFEACPVDCCGRKKAPGQLMCWRHWRLVPLAMKRAVKDTWLVLQETAGARCMGDAQEPFVKAASAAVAHVNAGQPTHPLSHSIERHADAYPCF